jgi:hypothetical protein
MCREGSEIDHRRILRREVKEKNDHQRKNQHLFVTRVAHK